MTSETAATEIYTLSLHDALPISSTRPSVPPAYSITPYGPTATSVSKPCVAIPSIDRKSTRLHSSHVKISYAVLCLKKKRTGIHAIRIHVKLLREINDGKTILYLN